MIDTKLPVKSVVADSPTMLVQIEKLPEYNAADEVVQEDQAALERDCAIFHLNCAILH